MVKHVGLAKYAAAVDHFDAQFRDLVLQKRILDGSWYNVQFANAIMTAAYAPAKNAADVCRISGIDVVTHLLGGIHRFLIQNLSPTTAVRHADLLFRN